MFAAKLKSYMKDKKITAQSIADEIGVSRGTVTHWSNGIRTPDPEQITKLVKILGIKVSDLFNDGEELKVKTIPLIGVASCGVPNIAYTDAVEYIPVNADLARDGVYAVKADGDSMSPKINNGDIIVCDKEAECINGNIVHYTTSEGESGIKKYLIDDKNVVTLMPINSDFMPVMCDVNDVKCARAIKIIADL